MERLLSRFRKRTQPSVSNVFVVSTNTKSRSGINESLGAKQRKGLGTEQSRLFELLEGTGDHMFVTGKAGTGKSHLLMYFIDHSAKNMMKVAPTGVAALNIGGETIHAAFMLPTRFIGEDEIIKNFETKRHYRRVKALRNIQTLVIDEISMVRADVMDAIDVTLRQCQDPARPFGGVQVLMFGDLYQLSPVIDDLELAKFFQHNYGGAFFFNANVWSMAELHTYELHENFRQKDRHFQTILDAIRAGSITQEQLEELNSRVVGPNFVAEDGAIVITGSNAEASSINSGRMAALPGDPMVFQARVEGDFHKRIMPAESLLELKKSAQVMCLRNFSDYPLYNGTIGTVGDLDHHEIHFTVDGIRYPVRTFTWEYHRHSYDGKTRRIAHETLGSFEQFPLRLAWAITVHKSQGKTFQSVVIDLSSGAFAAGQTYVALSRCTSLERTMLVGKIRPSDIRVDPTVVKFMASAKVVSA